MKNTYDILVNFKEVAYEFYEWNKNDDIKHIKLIPTFRVSSDCLLDFCNNNILVSKDFLEKIKNKTEVFYRGIVRTQDYACILFCDQKAMAFDFSSDGKLIGKSNLLLDEADDVISSFFDLEESKIDYNVISVGKKTLGHTRKESKIIESLLKYLSDIYEKKKGFEIKYIYFECFDKENDDEQRAYLELVNQIEAANFNVIQKLKSLIKVLKK